MTTHTGLQAALDAAREMPSTAAPGPSAPTPPPPEPQPAAVAEPQPAVRVATRDREQSGRLAVTSQSCSAVREVEPQSLGVSWWYDAPDRGEPHDLTVRFEGERLDGPPSSLPTSFGSETTVTAVQPGSGRAAVTARVTGIAPGSYEVRAAPVRPQPRTPSAPVQGRTGFAPVVRVAGPGVVLGAWPALVLLGTLLALVVQNRLAVRTELPAGRVLALTGLACFIGVAGAKIYYLLTHRGERTGVPTAGMSVQGFVLGAVGTPALGALLLDLSVPRVLDVTAPGLLFGMTVGRFGCLLGGCCAGRPTSSRWGVRSSDRRLLARRLPVQLFEGAVAAAAAVAAWLLITVGRNEPAGAVFVGALAAYTLGRQLLFPLRDLPRATRHGRTAMIAVTSALVVAAAAALA